MVREQKVEMFYKRIKDSISHSSTSPLLVFPSTSDVDSLCALKIILRVLESDSVRYACYAVSSFQEIHSHISADSVVNPDEPLALLLINWGNQRDLNQMITSRLNTRVFVIDSHRPIHLSNLRDDNDRVVVLFTKDDELQSDIAFDFDVTSLANSVDNEQETNDSDSNSDSDSDSNVEEGRRKKRRTDEATQSVSKLKKAYYRMGNYHGKPSGCLMNELAHLLRKNTNEVLWLACVSLTDQYVHDRLTEERYQAGVMELEHHINSMGNLEATSTVTLKDGTKIRAPESQRITYEDEPKLMLLREWTLFDSMLCSSYIATKLKTWTDNGLKKLKFLLARMGFALSECKQKYPYMNLDIKNKMRHEFEKFLPQYGLTDFYFRSFIRLHGYSSKVSAADVVYGVTALLESDSDAGFASAYDALAVGNLEKLKEGMRMAIEVQRAILKEGSGVMGSVRSNRKFRWVRVEGTAVGRVLGVPQALVRLGYFVMDALREKGARWKPVVCAAAYRGSERRALVVGVGGRPRLGAERGNAFGDAFRDAANEVGGEYFHDMFETSWIVVEKDAVGSFMIRLSLKM